MVKLVDTINIKYITYVQLYYKNLYTTILIVIIVLNTD